MRRSRMNMFKQIISIINRLLLLGHTPQMSQKWKEEQLGDYEAAQNKAAGLY